MVWGCFDWRDFGGLWFMPKNTTMNADAYISLLRSKISQFMAIGSYEVFQQDGNPCHSARKVQKWLRDNHITVLEWPGESPDLNQLRICGGSWSSNLPKNTQENWLTFRTLSRLFGAKKYRMSCAINLFTTCLERLHTIIKLKGVMSPSGQTNLFKMLWLCI